MLYEVITIMGAVTRVRNCLAQAIHRFFHEQGFMWIATPLITASDCEGAGEMFRVSTLDLENLVITSYSIHYTKLYDDNSALHQDDK